MRLSIGEMSKLHGITIQTLRYYDKIDLLKPSEVDPRTNYRYYYLEACDRLARINIFKSLGLPLEDIKKNVKWQSYRYRTGITVCSRYG